MRLEKVGHFLELRRHLTSGNSDGKVPESPQECVRPAGGIRGPGPFIVSTSELSIPSSAR